MITENILRSIYRYDPNTGIFTYLKHRTKPELIGTVAGIRYPDGYLKLYIAGKQYPAHHMAWLYAYGSLPKKFLDHKNLVRDDNRIRNLREATSSQNNVNVGKRVTNTSGYKGVSKSFRGNSWRAQIVFEHKFYHLGLFATPEEAHEAYKKAALEIHGEFANFG